MGGKRSDDIKKHQHFRVMCFQGRYERTREQPEDEVVDSEQALHRFELVSLTDCVVLSGTVTV